MKKILQRIALAGMLFAGTLSAVPVLAEDSKTPTIDVSGFGYLMFGQMMSGYIDDNSNTKETQHMWQNFGEVDLFASSRATDWFSSKVGLRLTNLFPLGTTNMQKSSFYMKFQPTIAVAEGIFNWDFNFLALEVESGIFPYNFNPNIKVLGNYLYRSTAYPLYLENKLDYPYFDMMGLRAQLAFLDKALKAEVMLNSKFDHPVWYDWSLGGTISYNFKNIVDIGIGSCFDHIFSVNDFETEGRHLKVNIQQVDTTTHDTTFYTYRSTKYDVRLGFDPKPIFGSPSIFGQEDLKLYGELGLIGLKDYKYYDTDPKASLSHRLPLMVGFNFPTFKVLDLLSFEVELFKSPWANSWTGQDNYGPRPVQAYNDTLLENYQKKDNVKWALYIKKKISKFEVTAFAANDHYTYLTFDQENRPCFEQSLRKPGNWHWYIKLQYNL